MKNIIYENFDSWNVKTEVKELTREQIKESSEQENIDFTGGYLVPIWILGVENLNGRTYPRELAERIISLNKITYALDGHPEDEINLKVEDIKAVGKNPVIEENILYVECFFVDEEFQKKIENLLKYNSKIGLSSVGYGELDNGKIVPETYELIRYFDFVFNPSYGVYLDSETEITKNEVSTNDDVSFSTEEETELSTESISNEEMEFLVDINNLRKKFRKG